MTIRIKGELSAKGAKGGSGVCGKCSYRHDLIDEYGFNKYDEVSILQIIQLCRIATVLEKLNYHMFEEPC